jgi:cephalosporin hydroxylase
VDRIEPSHPRVEFRQVDLNNLDGLNRDFISSLPHPWLLIEDAHTNVYDLLQFFAAMMLAGDYLVVEDTINYVKYRKVKKFVFDQKDAFLVDTHFTDLFGYNVTWNPNSYLKKVK